MNIEVKVYEGRLGYEHYLFDINVNTNCVPIKDAFIFWGDTMYKVLYTLTDCDNNTECIFVRKAVEEDY